MASKKSENLLDVAIVGAGVSGVYSAMRLMQSQRTGLSPLRKEKLKISVFEQSNRIGGRLLSLTPPGVESTRVEVGGMRYTSEHKYVRWLVDKFKLTPLDFPVRENQNIAYFRGKQLRMGELSDMNKVPYNINQQEWSCGIQAGGFTALAATRLLRTITSKKVNLATVDWRVVGRELNFEGTSLYDLSIRYLMQRMISHEAYCYAVDTCGYDSILYTWNGVDGFPWNLGDFDANVKFYRLEQGYQQIPLHCARTFGDTGGNICMEHRLIRFHCIELDDGSTGVEFVLDNKGREITMHARNLILAMPRRALELLEPTGAVMNSENREVREMIESVTPIPLFKLALCYSYPWWESLPTYEVVSSDGSKEMKRITKGESITDLPVRQLYYWATDEETGNAVVLIYDDGLALSFWSGLRDHEENFDGQSVSHTTDALSSWSDFPAPDRMVKEAHRQILEMHGVTQEADVPLPYAASFQDWGEDPYGGGANFWHVGSRSHIVSKNIVQPLADLPVFICGESYSHQQGWVEGALSTAEDMLQQHLGLLPPSLG